MCDYISMDYNEIVNFICKNNTCVLSVAKNNLPYAVPMYYEAYNDCGNIHLKLRSKDTGKKMNYMYTNENVCILIIHEIRRFVNRGKGKNFQKNDCG